MVCLDSKLESGEVKASASFSIWAYLLPVVVMDLNIYATGLTSPITCFCISTAPRPNEDASAKTVVTRLGSKSERIGLALRASLTYVNALH